jgi:RNA 2',3'-cyclic 3'-phosphodiesterase
MLTSNLFLAVLPDFYSATQITQIANSHRARSGFARKAIAQDRLHVSLYWLPFNDRVMDQVIQHVGRAAEEAVVAVPPFRVEFDRLVSFRGSGAFVLLSRTANSVLQEFRQGLGAALRRHGVRCDRSEFQPHITLLYDRNHSVAEKVVEPVSWVANEIVLIRSLLGEGEYRILERWMLRG